MKSQLVITTCKGKKEGEVMMVGRRDRWDGGVGTRKEAITVPVLLWEKRGTTVVHLKRGKKKKKKKKKRPSWGKKGGM